MNENGASLSIEDDGASAFPGASVSPKRFRPRWNLLTLMLIAGLVCTWSLYFRVRRDNTRLQSGIVAMQGLSRKLVIEYPDRVAIVQSPRTWYGESKWVIATPDANAAATNRGAAYKVCLATRELDIRATVGPDPRVADSVSPAAECLLPRGHCNLELKSIPEGELWKIVVLLDDQPVIEVSESADWNPGYGSSGGAHHEQPFQPSDASLPAVLYHRIFMIETTEGKFSSPQDPANGLMLWLQPINPGEMSNEAKSSDEG